MKKLVFNSLIISLFGFILFIISCGYTDIDSVPSFEDINISDDEAIEMCSLSFKNDEKNLINCLMPIYKIIPNFEKLDITENQSIYLCKSINADRNDLLKCLTALYEVKF